MLSYAFMIVLACGLRPLTSQQDVSGFDLSGKYYHVKSQAPITYGGYMLDTYQNSVESALNEVDNTFTELEEELERSIYLDYAEFALLILSYILLATLACFFKSQCSKTSALEQRHYSIIPMLKTHSENSQLGLLRNLLRAPNADSPTTSGDNRFLEI